MTRYIIFLISLALVSPAFSFGAPKEFDSTAAAKDELLSAAKSNSQEELVRIFGDDAHDLIFSGDSVADQAAMDRFAALTSKGAEIVSDGNEKAHLKVESNDWVFPIPLVEHAGKWSFDVDQGKEEILNRRIGENELAALKISKFYVRAQELYASEDRNGDGVKEYAQKLMSSEGQRDGLYWKSKSYSDVSPFGPLVAKAMGEGYGKEKRSVPLYKGYHFKSLMKQGRNAKIGAKNYLKNGKMTEGYALLAYPAEWGASGIMSFLVNQDAIVYERDLGKETEKRAQAIQSFDPDASWAIAEDY